MSKSDQSHQPETGDGIAAEAQGLTRREWILRLGEATVLAGFSGSAAGALAAPLATIPSKTLPPGLYEPSGEHVAHILLREERFVTPPAGSETEYVKRQPAAFQPDFFSTEDYKVARRLVELMLNARTEAAAAPALPPVDTDTLDEIAEWIDLMLAQAAATREAAKGLSAQHRELAIHYYDEEAVRHVETADPQATWKDGLARLDHESQKISGQGFLALDEARQMQMLNSINDSSGTTETPGRSLYRLARADAIRGYYTSRAGLKELDYKGNAFYPESPGCPKK